MTNDRQHFVDQRKHYDSSHTFLHLSESETFVEGTFLGLDESITEILALLCFAITGILILDIYCTGTYVLHRNSFR